MLCSFEENILLMPTNSIWNKGVCYFEFWSTRVVIKETFRAELAWICPIVGIHVDGMMIADDQSLCWYLKVTQHRFLLRQMRYSKRHWNRNSDKCNQWYF